MIKQEKKLDIPSSILALKIADKLICRKKFLQNMPARFITEQEFKEYKRLQRIEQLFLH